MRALVVAMHETPAYLEKNLREQLEFAAQHFEISTLEGFAKLWDGSPEPEAGSKPLLLFTFDDGRESNYAVAAPLLESFGGRGVFFVVPGYAECSSDEEAHAFYRTRINPDWRPESEKPESEKLGSEKSARENPGREAEDWRPMNPTQIAELASRGHAIGNHTLTHERLAGLSEETLEREIGDSARQIASWTKKPVDAFAWTFGWDAIDASAWRVIQRHHRFCFSPCAGAIDLPGDRPSLLWRREIEARYSAAEYRFCYSGVVDLWWRARRARLRDMMKASSTRSVAPQPAANEGSR